MIQFNSGIPGVCDVGANVGELHERRVSSRNSPTFFAAIKIRNGSSPFGTPTASLMHIYTTITGQQKNNADKFDYRYAMHKLSSWERNERT